jgi:hypothetical protein
MDIAQLTRGCVCSEAATVTSVCTSRPLAIGLTMQISTKSRMNTLKRKIKQNGCMSTCSGSVGYCADDGFSSSLKSSNAWPWCEADHFSEGNQKYI